MVIVFLFFVFCLLFVVLIAFAFVPVFTNIRNNNDANREMWPVGDQYVDKDGQNDRKGENKKFRK